MNFKDIKPLTPEGAYETDFFLVRIPIKIKEFEAEGLQMCPDFQRGHVWTETQQSRYVEYILRGGKTARVIYFNHTQWGQGGGKKQGAEFVCVDGLQRITAVTRFVNNEIKCFGHYFKEFEGCIRNIHTLRFNINNLPTKAAVLQWYLEINDTGTPHAATELKRVKELLKKEIKK